jgi:hypothetical protein
MMRTLLDGLRSSMTVQVLWDLAAQNSPISSVYGWDPVELCLAAQCLRLLEIVHIEGACMSCLIWVTV